MSWISLIRNAAKTIAQQVNKSKAASNAAKPAPKSPQKAVKADNQKQAEATKQQEKEKYTKDADKVRDELEKKGGGSYPVEDVKSHDGSISNTYAPGNDNGNSGGNYNPPREPKSSHRGKAKDKGPSL